MGVVDISELRLTRAVRRRYRGDGNIDGDFLWLYSWILAKVSP